MNGRGLVVLVIMVSHLPATGGDVSLWVLFGYFAPPKKAKIKCQFGNFRDHKKGAFGHFGHPKKESILHFLSP